MKIASLNILEKHLKKKRGNRKLKNEVDKLIEILKGANWSNSEEIKSIRPDADKVHSKGFYFFNISSDRTMILIELEEDQATIVWCGSHDEYEYTFKNNKNTIRKWLQAKNWI
ncbi:type II toxin-antitoxin system HigB family toxin [Portibacter lacus]|uniref:Type II toxin-antitoxin system HigB family toxin n=1 Tax=Portibacter lacus TaxID=1099794 RepID=A0AA37SU12_9BACT|nr:type II toxin-antitoxin system HigB family toxin [Portibacter lacus]GLR19569.1 hypothetical protein GCM10007940_41850 [Portibacter lacus]